MRKYSCSTCDVDFRMCILLIYWYSLTYREKHSKNLCAMYDICGERSDGKVLNCPYNYPAVKVCNFVHSLPCWPSKPIQFMLINWGDKLFKCHLQPDDLFSAKIQSLCPTISGNVCCTEAQFDTLRQQVQQVQIFSLYSSLWISIFWSVLLCFRPEMNI